MKNFINWDKDKKEDYSDPTFSPSEKKKFLSFTILMAVVLFAVGMGSMLSMNLGPRFLSSPIDGAVDDGYYGNVEESDDEESEQEIIQTVNTGGGGSSSRTNRKKDSVDIDPIVDPRIIVDFISNYRPWNGGEFKRSVWWDGEFEDQTTYAFTVTYENKRGEEAIDVENIVGEIYKVNELVTYDIDEEGKIITFSDEEERRLVEIIEFSTKDSLDIVGKGSIDWQTKIPDVVEELNKTEYINPDVNDSNQYPIIINKVRYELEITAEASDGEGNYKDTAIFGPVPLDVSDSDPDRAKSNDEKEMLDAQKTKEEAEEEEELDEEAYKEWSEEDWIEGLKYKYGEEESEYDYQEDPESEFEYRKNPDGPDGPDGSMDINLEGSDADPGTTSFNTYNGINNPSYNNETNSSENITFWSKVKDTFSSIVFGVMDFLGLGGDKVEEDNPAMADVEITFISKLEGPVVAVIEDGQEYEFDTVYTHSNGESMNAAVPHATVYLREDYEEVNKDKRVGERDRFSKNSIVIPIPVSMRSELGDLRVEAGSSINWSMKIPPLNISPLEEETLVFIEGKEYSVKKVYTLRIQTSVSDDNDSFDLASTEMLTVSRE